jgi:L-ascorbate metabolism protein UlaG (beta-lactamase superfamily)
MTTMIPHGSVFRFDRADETDHSAMRAAARAVAEKVRGGMALETAVASYLAEVPEAKTIIAFDEALGAPSFGLKPELLFPSAPAALTRFEFRRFEERATLVLDEAVPLPELARFLSRCTTGIDDKARAEFDETLPELLDAMMATKVVVPAEAPPFDFAPRGAAGLARLQHASVLLQSATTGILFDPHLHSLYEPSLVRNVRRYDLEGRVDAILLSHSHGDHYDLTSLLTFPADTPIFVPRVERGNLLCEDIAARLRSFGFTHVIDVPWYAPPIVVGDIEVHVLPFYGEQPLATDAARDPALRNWGNTYFARTPTYSAWIVIDSGNDPMGRAADVARHIRTHLGGVDLVLCNLQEFRPFASNYITGGGHYWFALSPEKMAVFPSLGRELLTLGAAGVAEICAAAGARWYVPYAHWWAEPGALPPEEPRMLEQLAGELRRHGAPTDILRWHIGDFARVESGAVIERIHTPLPTMDARLWQV